MSQSDYKIHKMSHQQGERGTNYQERVQRLFERVKNIQNITEEEKMNKMKELEKCVADLDRKTLRRKEERVLKQDGFAEKLGQLRTTLESEVEARVKLESQMTAELDHLERYCIKIAEEARTLRDESDRKLVTKLNNSIELLQIDIQRGATANHFEANSELEHLLKVELPKLQKELNNECELRKELEQKILEQFMQQVHELTDLYFEEKKKRELKEEDLLNAISTIAKDVEAALKKQRADREKNEESILELVEKVIERLKRDVTA